jgi:cullin-4
MAHCIVRANFAEWRHELVLSAYQCFVLLLFNDADSLSLSDIRRLSLLSDKDLIPVLISLSCGKIRILRKEPLSKTVSEGDTFHYVPSFREKFFRIKINQVCNMYFFFLLYFFL